MNVQFAIAGALALFAAAIHGGVGESLVVSRLHRDTLEPTKFGGRTTTMLMIRVTWHIVTLVFLVTGAALLVCTPDGSGQACAGVGRIASVSFGSFFALAAVLSVAAQGPRVGRTMLRHPGPLVFALMAALTWWGSTS